MATDSEKLAMLDRAYACDLCRKVALEVAKHLSTLELRSLTVEEEEKVRNKLTDARAAWAEAAHIVSQLLKEPVNHGRSHEGPLFDAKAPAGAAA